MPRMTVAGYLICALLVAVVIGAFVIRSQSAANRTLSNDVKRLEGIERELLEQRAAQVRLNQELAIQDAEHYKALEESRRENAMLRAAERTGDVRLSVHATCPQLPDTAGAASVGDAAGPELTPDARSAYFDHTDGIDTITEQIGACQDYARTVSAPNELDSVLSTHRIPP